MDLPTLSSVLCSSESHTHLALGTPLSLSLSSLRSNPKAMATARVLAVSNTSCLLSKTTSFLAKQRPYRNNLCFTRRAAAVPSLSRRSLTCRAIYNPEVQIKEEGQPETLDYRVFFVDRSGQKVVIFLRFNLLFVWILRNCKC